MGITKNVLATGIKLNIGPNLLKDLPHDDFILELECSIEGLGVPAENRLTCRFYDDITGDIYLHYDTPILTEQLDGIFSEMEIIHPL